MKNLNLALTKETFLSHIHLLETRIVIYNICLKIPEIFLYIYIDLYSDFIVS